MTRQRLSRKEVAALPAITERDFQRQVMELAELYGWETYHSRPARTIDSWRTPGSGTMAKGWPDLCLVHPVERRVIFAELKSDTGRLTPDQERVIGVLDELSDRSSPFGGPKVEVYVWRPKFWSYIEAALKRREAA